MDTNTNNTKENTMKNDPVVYAQLLDSIVQRLDRSADELEEALIVLNDMDEDEVVSELIDAQIGIVRQCFTLEKMAADLRRR